jgi:nucleotide-binding universal stress UspA family protein
MACVVRACRPARISVATELEAGTIWRDGAVVMPAVSRVVAGVSGSPGSLAALRYAEYLADAHGAVLVPVIAWEPPGGDRAVRVQPGSGLTQVWRDMACDRLALALEAVWGGLMPEPVVQAHVERGPAGWVLVNVADHPGDVLVIGAGHGGPFRRALRCHVVRYCVAKASCPVALVPAPELVAKIGGLWSAWRLRRRTLTLAQVLGEQRRPHVG